MNGTLAPIPLPISAELPWELPESIMFSMSSIREDPMPMSTPAVFRLSAPVANIPVVLTTEKVAAPPTKTVSHIEPIRFKRRRIAPQPKAMPSVRPSYSPDDNQVIELLEEFSKEPLDAYPFNSQRPRWILVVAALSIHCHPTHPAHLAFWRPEVMNETGEAIDEFLKTREAKYLLSREGWVDAEISLYTLRGYQRGYYPELYAPNQSTRTLRKRKAGMLAARGDQLEGLFEEEERSKKRARRSTRRTTVSRKKPIVPEDAGSPMSSLTPLAETPVLDGDAPLPADEPPVPMRTRSSSKTIRDQELSSLLAVPVPNRKRSHSGVSLTSSVVTLVDDDDDDETGSVMSVDTVVESAVDSKTTGQDKLSLLVDLAASSPSSALSTASLSPPPSPRRSHRAVQPTKRRRDLDEEEVISRPRTRLATASPAAPRRNRRARK